MMWRGKWRLERAAPYQGGRDDGAVVGVEDDAGEDLFQLLLGELGLERLENDEWDVRLDRVLQDVGGGGGGQQVAHPLHRVLHLARLPVVQLVGEVVQP